MTDFFSLSLMLMAVNHWEILRKRKALQETPDLPLFVIFKFCLLFLFIAHIPASLLCIFPFSLFTLFLFISSWCIILFSATSQQEIHLVNSCLAACFETWNFFFSFTSLMVRYSFFVLARQRLIISCMQFLQLHTHNEWSPIVTDIKQLPELQMSIH